MLFFNGLVRSQDGAVERGDVRHGGREAVNAATGEGCGRYCTRGVFFVLTAERRRADNVSTQISSRSCGVNRTPSHVFVRCFKSRDKHLLFDSPIVCRILTHAIIGAWLQSHLPLPRPGAEAAATAAETATRTSSSLPVWCARVPLELLFGLSKINTNRRVRASSTGRGWHTR